MTKHEQPIPAETMAQLTRGFANVMEDVGAIHRRFVEGVVRALRSDDDAQG